jgi:hypothetical protein
MGKKLTANDGLNLVYVLTLQNVLKLAVDKKSGKLPGHTYVSLGILSAQVLRGELTITVQKLCE